MVALAQPALAGNRAFSARLAVLDTPASAPCFAHGPGDPTLKNTCTTSQNVFLPLSVDAAAWYRVSIYARGLITPSGSRNTIWCVVNAGGHDGTSLGSSGWQALPNDGSFGAAQTLTLAPVPIYSPGDSAYAYCVMGPSTTIFSYGWN